MSGRWSHLLKGRRLGGKQVYVKKCKLLLWTQYVWNTHLRDNQLEISRRCVCKWWRAGREDVWAGDRSMNVLRVRLCCFSFCLSLLLLLTPNLPNSLSSLSSQLWHHFLKDPSLLLPQNKSAWIRLSTGLSISIFFSSKHSSWFGIKDLCLLVL